MTKVLKGVSNIENYRGIWIGLEATPDQDYYCMLGTRLVKSQLKEQLHSEIDNYLDNKQIIDNTDDEVYCDYHVEYLPVRSEYLTQITIQLPMTENFMELRNHAWTALQKRKVKFRTITNISRSRD